MPQTVQCRKQIDELLSIPRQIWLLGAGSSKPAGIPLMVPLTDRVQSLLENDQKNAYAAIREELSEGAHVEHILSQIGDLVAVADRTKNKSVKVGGQIQTIDTLVALHLQIQEKIRSIIHQGYVPANGENPEKIGTEHASIVDIRYHINFVEALFGFRRAGLESRPPVAFFTLNYDTLLEDALALGRIVCMDGFCGGAMAFWNPDEEFKCALKANDQVQAKVYKLHGSIDWIVDAADLVVRRRDGTGYISAPQSKLLIYPQANKYKVTQRDPFAVLFEAFRNALNGPEPAVLSICGYSFGDEHVNEEIERAMRQRGNRLTILAFVKQDETNLLGAGAGLPSKIAQWLSDESEGFRKRIVVAGSHGIYHGACLNKCPCSPEKPHEWWTFEGLTSVLKEGPEGLK